MYPAAEEKDNHPHLRRSKTGQGSVDPGNSQSNSDKEKGNQILVPQITLPKGDGILKGIDEKFEVNAVNRTASFSIPPPFFRPHSNFVPTLFPHYNSNSSIENNQSSSLEPGNTIVKQHHFLNH